MKKKLYRYRWVLAFIAGFITSIIVSLWFFKEDFNSALRSSVSGAIGAGVAIFLSCYYKKKKMNKAQNVQLSDPEVSGMP